MARRKFLSRSLLMRRRGDGDPECVGVVRRLSSVMSNAVAIPVGRGAVYGAIPTMGLFFTHA